ncbi:MAG: integration host factor subunit alpha [Thermodesulfobacteriota bacterium]|nr:integration host factor subunit alpha [Thermodesulfobacteriota bacterium]
MALTKDQIVKSVRTKCDLSKKTSFQAVESIMNIIKRTLASGEDVLITGFGKFCVREKTERLGRNPQTGAKMTLRPRRVVTFKWSGVLRDKMNGNR